jgi:O-antigen/teichoic acid export membrane protein
MDKQKSYFKNIVILFKGSSISQLLPILASPLLTNIYSPEEFGSYSKFISFIMILVPLGTLKYDQALFLPKGRKGLNSLFGLILIILFVVTATLSFILCINYFLGFYKIDYWIFVPIVFLAINLNNIIEQISVRFSEFKRTSISISIRSTLNVTLQLGLGLLNFSVIGFILANLIGAFGSFIFLLKSAYKNIHFKSLFSFKNLKADFKKYVRFPIYILPSEIFASISTNFLPILLASKFSLQDIGYFYLTTKIVGLPTTVLGRSISQVFYSKISENYRLNKKHYNSKLLKETLLKISLILFPMLVLSYFLVDLIVTTFFGYEWITTATFFKILAPFYFIKLISSSFSSVLIIYKKQRLELLINILLFILTFSSFILSNNIDSFLYIYSTTLSVVYVSLLIFYFKTLNSD